jgi:hypothetical protein
MGAMTNRMIWICPKMWYAPKTVVVAVAVAVAVVVVAVVVVAAACFFTFIFKAKIVK